MKYWLVDIQFLDHVMANGEIVEEMPCRVFGLLRETTKTSYIVCSWAASPFLNTSNDECFAILKKSVRKMRKVRQLEVSLVP